MKRRLVLDTNVLISALLFGGKPEKVYRKVLSNQCMGFVSKEIFEELSSVLLRKKFGFTETFIQLLEDEMKSYFHWIVPVKRIKSTCRDIDDHKVIECALTAGADVIVTGDQDLLVLHRYRNILVLTPDDYLELD